MSMSRLEHLHIKERDKKTNGLICPPFKPLKLEKYQLRSHHLDTKNLRQFEVPGGIAFTSSIEESDHQKSIYSKSIPRVFDFGIQYYTVGAKMNRMVSTQPNLIQMISDGDLAEKDRKTR